MADLPAHEIAWLRHFITSTRWTYAKTYAKSYPHEYVTRYKMIPAEEFDHFHRLITQFGHIQMFQGIPRPYLIIDDWKYWRMDRVLIPGTVFVINRSQPPDLVYGPQWASDTRRGGPPSIYDWQSVDWDVRVPSWVTDDELYEVTKIIKAMVEWRSVLNIGCGYGRVLDMAVVEPSLYLGLDPSQGMLNVHVERRKRYRVLPMTLAEFASQNVSTFETVLALFGTADHLTAEEIVAADELADDFLLLMHHGSVKPIAEVHPEAIEAARSLPNIQEVQYGRWLAYVRTERA